VITLPACTYPAHTVTVQLPAVEPRGRVAAGEPDGPVGSQRLAHGGHAALRRVGPAPRPRERHRGSALWLRRRRPRGMARSDPSSTAAETERTTHGIVSWPNRAKNSGEVVVRYLGCRLHVAKELADRAMRRRTEGAEQVIGKEVDYDGGRFIRSGLQDREEEGAACVAVCGYPTQ
jgi:hypothetical protein